MKHSLRIKVTIILTVTLVIAIVICWLLNATLLEDFYQYTKIDTLDSAYNNINDILSGDYSDGEISDTDSIKVSKASVAKNITTYILLPGDDVYYFIYPAMQDIKSIRTTEYERVKSALIIYLYGNTQLSGIERLTSINGKYDIYKMYDKQIESNYIDLVGYMDNGCIVFLRTNFESIQESVAISNTFLIYTGLIAVIAGSLIMLFFSKSITRPINRLSIIAQKMSALDFDAKYEDNRKDEIGNLGSSINQLSERLEHTISELKTANAELNKDIQNKIQIDEMRKEFLSNVSHELKTPIALIQGYAEGLLDNINDDSESREFYCEVIIDEADKMNKMVKKLLSLNQLESGSNHIEIERFDIVELVSSVLNNTEILRKQKNAKLYFDSYEPICVWADEYMIEEVLTNYISNAINHVNENGIIEVQLIQKPDVVRVAVFNTGDNIPDTDLEYIWEKFYKVDKARTREYGGNGIGLSIVKAIMTSHNKPYGAINRESGVEFWIDLDTNI